MSKPENVYKDEKVLSEKKSFKYLKRMKKNRWWRKGWEAGKKKQGEHENPYQLTPDVMELLRKRTYWEMGRIEAAFTPSKKRLKEEAERQKARQKERHKHARHTSKDERKHRRKDRHSNS
jgi:hypothetical protein